MNGTILWDDGWSFRKTMLGVMYEEALAGEFLEVDIPHDWLIYDTDNLYQSSIGWYRKSFDITQEQLGRKLIVRFGAVYMDSTVYVNGSEVCEWKYGYSTFDADITAYVHEGKNEIVVRAVYKEPNTRWYSGAGIIRDVYFLSLEPLHIVPDGTYIRVKKLKSEASNPLISDSITNDACGMRMNRDEDGTWKVKCTVELENSGQDIAYEDVKACLSIDHDGGSVFTYGHAAAGSGSVFKTGSKENVELELDVTKPLIWDIEEPNLYDCTVTVSIKDEIVHELTQKIGFCTKEYSPEHGFILNGRKVRINGVCEHHDNGCLGAAFNVNAFRRKLNKLRKMGVNAIRTSHNMPAKEVLELADEMGFLVDCEAFDMWELPKTEFDYARFFVEWAGKDVASWIRRDRNHVSVIMWSIGNEIYDTHRDEHGQEITRRLVGYVREHDPECNAPVTIGSNYMPWENAQKCADIVKLAGYNYAEKYYEEHHKAHPDWVIYGSETASTLQSRGIYKFPFEQQILCDDDEQCSALGNCTTNWGARSSEYCITMDADAEYSMGQFLWTGFDYIGEPTPYQTKNSYFGQIDTAGFEKDTYYIYQAEWTDYKKAPMVHLFPYWDFSDGEEIDVRIASNAPQVELFVNGSSYGKYDIDHKHGKQLLAHYKVKYEPGTIEAVAYDEEGNVIAREAKKSFSDAVQLVVAPENTQIMADGRDLAYIDISAVDNAGNPVENANNRVSVKVTGAGRLLGMDNGNSADFEQYKTNSRRMFSGKILAVIGAKTEPGEIRVEVSSVGMETKAVTLSAVEADVDMTGVSCTENHSRSDYIVVDKTEKLNAEYEESFIDNERNNANDEIPVRNIRLIVKGSRKLGPDNRHVEIEAEILPHNATYRDIVWRVTNDAGVDSNGAELSDVKAPVNNADTGKDSFRIHKVLKALGDGKHNVRCCVKNGRDKISLISQVSFTAEGLGLAEFNPYEFIYGTLYTVAEQIPSVGQDRGIVPKGGTYIAFEKVNFGKNGSDEITIPVYELNNKPFPIEIWKGIPGTEGAELMDRVIYDKPSIWATYQEKTYKLPKRFKGLCTVSFIADHDINIKGFSFKKYERAYDKNLAVDNDGIYGDTYTVCNDAVTGIGNNVSLTYKAMNLSQGIHGITICGRSVLEKNTIHIRFANSEGGINRIAEFVMADDSRMDNMNDSRNRNVHGNEDDGGYVCRHFELDNVEGIYDVNLVFLPGCNFDLKWFRFE